MLLGRYVEGLEERVSWLVDTVVMKSVGEWSACTSHHNHEKWA